MRKSLVSALLVLVMTMFMVISGFSWGSATHAFIAKKTGRYYLALDFQELYGSLAPDLFNYNFDLYADPVLRAFTHGTPGNEAFMSVWEKATYRNFQKALAYGFVAHNDVWGADFTAHHQAQSIAPPDDFPLVPGEIEPGYVMIKAVALNADPTINNYFESLGLYNADPGQFRLRLELCHNLVESAGDLIIRKVDARIGEDIIAAAVVRDKSFQNLLITALNNPDYNSAIRENEVLFRRFMVQYGAILILPEFRALKGLAESLAQSGVLLLKKMAGIDIPLDRATEIAEYGLKKSIQLCAPDYMNEVRKTIEKVRLEMRSRNIRY
ncbi:MAG: hypothetical protein OP8BY_2269 [Candidatus Saccharicenans subterraneus]|uniref:Uncharacterized protein n=1 Tax=Candidatus Saccharicenans subterraneus TaxID=2508984 RepID=A0A3E2BMB9_9BACT|nr:MAG: hypothetical protein OP8BY_2269 [Candidatus Saccharicenans subterraneum]